MDVRLLPGTYVVAVSGGVDSMALLHALAEQTKPAAGARTKLVVAHLDHGIRTDSAEDRMLVQMAARHYRLPFVYKEAKLGAGANEAEARQIRYNFLRHTQRASNARAILTAHHQDDVLETAIINLLRGSGRKGLTSLSSRHDVIRPLLHVPKRDLVAYANEHGLHWHEDSTNQNTVYTRNYVRHRLLTRFDESARQQLLDIITGLEKVNNQLDTLLVSQLHLQPRRGKLNRNWFNGLPHIVAREILATWLRVNGVRDFDKRTLERLVVAAKTASPGTQFDILHAVTLKVGQDDLALAGLER